jgi:serine/threonine-protein kinase
VWALALLVFWALCGKSYWRTAQLGGGSVPQLMREVLFEPMVPASQRAREIAPDVMLPPGFDAWFARCTARAAAERHPNASAAGVELFTHVLGVSAGVASVAGGPMTLPSSPLPASALAPAGSQPATQPSPFLPAITATPVATGPRPSSAGNIALVIGGLVVVLGIGLIAVLGIGGVLWFSSSAEEPSSPATAGNGAPEAHTPVEEPPGHEPSGPAPSPPVPKPATAATPPNPAKAEGPAPSAAATPKPKTAYSAGQKVDVSWGGSWWQGQINAVKNDKYLVHYIGWDSSWDEWVTTARLRPWSGSARSK